MTYINYLKSLAENDIFGNTKSDDYELYNTRENFDDYISQYATNNGYFAYDGCHKIYILEDEADEQLAREYDYYIYAINELYDTFKSSCPLRFINNWKLTKN